MSERYDRELTVHERLLRRDSHPPELYKIVGDHPEDPHFYQVAFDDGLTTPVPKEAVWMLPQLARIHRDWRRQAREVLGEDLRDLVRSAP